MPIEGTFSFDSFRTAQQVRSAFILLRMGINSSYAGPLYVGKIGLIEQSCG